MSEFRVFSDTSRRLTMRMTRYIPLRSLIGAEMCSSCGKSAPCQPPQRRPFIGPVTGLTANSPASKGYWALQHLGRSRQLSRETTVYSISSPRHEAGKDFERPAGCVLRTCLVGGASLYFQKTGI